jgi:hypothetical protein
MVTWDRGANDGALRPLRVNDLVRHVPPRGVVACGGVTQLREHPDRRDGTRTDLVKGVVKVIR